MMASPKMTGMCTGLLMDQIVVVVVVVTALDVVVESVETRQDG